MHHYQLHLRTLSLSQKCPSGISHRVLYSSEPLKLTGRDGCSTILGGLDILVESDEQPWHVSIVNRGEGLLSHTWRSHLRPGCDKFLERSLRSK